ncbi:PP2C family serine/threonine-protein phosphatase [Hyphomicrobium sp.]|uniref:PP2C family serine/threonine-protein phosphatase n=1 Tax=Hyphomicrobium sp. TaxID=82 RepID=UPI000FA52C1E|nr:PP2C family serine/threonine-protein phosphatase [Hyphomicrobium sp.]RUO97679.1 MAG: protein phosphatase 2C domain-containing protein [Hyphomicrobium sp.]
MKAWRWALASARGTSHAVSNESCDDAGFCAMSHGASSSIFATLSDGAGSAQFGGYGAWLAVRSMTLNMRAHLKKSSSVTEDDFWEWIDVSRDVITHVAERREVARRDFAATLISIVSDGNETIIAHIGDGSVVAKLEAGSWQALSWPSQGEYASTTYFITDDPKPRLQITRFTEPLTRLVAFTDGLERLALDFTNGVPFEPFLEAISTPVAQSQATARDGNLSRALRDFLNSARVNERTDDDKTLLVAALK